MKSLRAKTAWNITFVKSTGYKEKHVKPVAEKLHELINSAESKALKNKFATPKYLEVSNLPISI